MIQGVHSSSEDTYVAIVRNWGLTGVSDGTVIVCTEPDEIENVRARFSVAKRRIRELGGGISLSQKFTFNTGN